MRDPTQEEMAAAFDGEDEPACGRCGESDYELCDRCGICCDCNEHCDYCGQCLTCDPRESNRCDHQPPNDVDRFCTLEALGFMPSVLKLSEFDGLTHREVLYCLEVGLTAAVAELRERVPDMLRYGQPTARHLAGAVGAMLCKVTFEAAEAVREER